MKKKTTSNVVIRKFENEEAWKEGRRGVVTGTKLKDMTLKRGGDYRMGFYELIAERIGVPRSEENVMDRGHRLEGEAIDRFSKDTGKKVNKDLVIVYREDDERIAYSPDGLIGKTEDVEVKCLSQSRHLEAFHTRKIPSEYWEQMLSGFVVNDKLRTRYMVFYDPSMPMDFFYISLHRKDVKKEVEMYLDQAREMLKVVDDFENKLTFY